MCFFRRLQRHTTATSFFTTHTHSQTQSLSHKHMPGQPWLAGQVVPEEFFSGFANYFWTTSGQQEFFRPTGGHATYENIILRELIVSFVYVSIFTQALCCKVR